MLTAEDYGLISTTGGSAVTYTLSITQIIPPPPVQMSLSKRQLKIPCNNVIGRVPQGSLLSSALFTLLANHLSQLVPSILVWMTPTFLSLNSGGFSIANRLSRSITGLPSITSTLYAVLLNHLSQFVSSILVEMTTFLSVNRKIFPVTAKTCLRRVSQGSLLSPALFTLLSDHPS